MLQPQKATKNRLSHNEESSPSIGIHLRAGAPSSVSSSPTLPLHPLHPACLTQVLTQERQHPVCRVRTGTLQTNVPDGAMVVSSYRVHLAVEDSGIASSASGKTSYRGTVRAHSPFIQCAARTTCIGTNQTSLETRITFFHRCISHHWKTPTLLFGHGFITRPVSRAESTDSSISSVWLMLVWNCRRQASLLNANECLSQVLLSTEPVQIIMKQIVTAAILRRKNNNNFAAQLDCRHDYASRCAAHFKKHVLLPSSDGCRPIVYCASRLKGVCPMCPIRSFHHKHLKQPFV